jgi:glycosyltransferase involved in cell wall biosynthesis
VLPSLTEGLSNALLEAMASGLPVLASRVPGIMNIVKEGEHGALFDPRSSADIESALNRLLPSDFATYAKHSRATAAEYSLDIITRRYLEIYDR